MVTTVVAIYVQGVYALESLQYLEHALPKRRDVSRGCRGVLLGEEVPQVAPVRKLDDYVSSSPLSEASVQTNDIAISCAEGA